MFIEEPMITIAQILAWYWRSIGVLNLFVNERGSLIMNLWALWGTDINHCITA